tara:strand:+ start:65 stop:289 length:225 start_codon:yes stop_codon:yes gene_type:complete
LRDYKNNCSRNRKRQEESRAYGNHTAGDSSIVYASKETSAMRYKTKRRIDQEIINPLITYYEKRKHRKACYSSK